ncbi:hypothetical protein M422DRAFT_48674 [Sphaerobolus stellatus SS14]|uniref:Uncharacterized protein n=1 Tax=Sphaerobolus stellatus (strain SS14) TaxID=990650 RepID=A0A0C9VS10_SPHS4|nr:hypothetical protein M422DRAFT_48674 [Sphaerobolus stellatus SS14]
MTILPLDSTYSLVDKKRDREHAFYQPFVLLKPVAFGISALLLLLGIAVQILRVVINEHLGGLPADDRSTTDDSAGLLTSIQHLLNPAVAGVVISACISATVASVDHALKKFEPYRQLAKAWISIFRNSHWIVLLSTFATLLSLALSPLSSTLFTIKPTQYPRSANVLVSSTPGLASGWDDLAPSFSAASHLASTFSGGASLPPYVTKDWAFPSFNLSDHIDGGRTSTTIVISAIKSTASCEATFTPTWFYSDNSTLTTGLTGIQTGISTEVTDPAFASGGISFNIRPLPVDSIEDPRSQPILIYIYFPEVGSNGYYLYPNLTAIICNATAYIQNVTMTFDSLGTIGSVVPVPSEQPKLLPFLNGSLGFNGCDLNTSSSHATLIGMQFQYISPKWPNLLLITFGRIPNASIAIFPEINFLRDHQQANNYFNNILIPNTPDGIVYVLQDIYQTYLSLFGASNYFNPTGYSDRQLLKGTNVGLVDRLFVSNFPADFISAILISIACMLALGFFMHHHPGSIAGVATLLVGSNLVDLTREYSKEPNKLGEIILEHKWSLVDGEIYAEIPTTVETDSTRIWSAWKEA